jgi:hypothetical protein
MTASRNRAEGGGSARLPTTQKRFSKNCLAQSDADQRDTDTPDLRQI